MTKTLKIGFLCWLFLNLISCHAQNDHEKTTLSEDFDKNPPFYYVMPTEISARDTSPGWPLQGERILLTGTVFENDGKTAAANVLLYYYQTNLAGLYVHLRSEVRSMPPNKLGQTHGYIRGWVKTNEQGKYEIYTVRPGAYSGRNEPSHIHMSVKEPDRKRHYYIDDFVFDDDKLLTTEKRRRQENRGGSGVLRLVRKNNLLIGERNIILGLNIPGYPKNSEGKFDSGKSIGENIISFTPFHAWGVDKGSNVCPICKYGWYHGVLYLVGNNPNWVEIKKWLIFLELESVKREKYLKVYFIYGNEKDYSKSGRVEELEKIGRDLQLEKVALTFVPDFSDSNSNIYLNQINPDLENTFLLYKRSNIIEKYVNLKPTAKNFQRVSTRLDETINEYFELPRAKIE